MSQQLEEQHTPARFRPVEDSVRVEVIEQVAALRDLRPEWEALAAVALEPNVFYEPYLLLPALEHLRDHEDHGQARFVLVHARDCSRPNAPEVLCGLFPLEKRRSFHGVPVSSYGLLGYRHCFLRTPLVHRDCATRVLQAFFEWLDDSAAVSCTNFRDIGGDGPFYQALCAQLHREHRAQWVSESYVRAVMRRAGNADEYLQRAINGGRLKEFRRQERRLAELGPLSYVALGDDEPLDAWIEGLLCVEGSGWKGECGSSLNSSESNQAFFRSVVEGARERGRLRMLALRVNDETIAQKCNFVSNGGSFAFKIGFDSRYGRYSPGVLLEIENVRRFHEEHDLSWMDSCAGSDHPMIDGLWSERRVIKSLLVSSGSLRGDLTVAAAPLMRQLKRRLVGA